MKKIYLTLLLLSLLKLTASAQVGIEMGLNMADLAIKSGGTTTGTTFKPGYNVGFIAAMALGDHGYFQPGLFYQMTGCKFTGAQTGKYNINTISIPLDFEYKSGEKCGSRFFFGAGPYIGYNINGNYSVDLGNGIPVATADVKIGNDKTDDLKPLDIGLGVHAGYQFKFRMYVRVRYQLGLTDLSEVSDGNNSIKSSAISVNIGYLFGHCNAFSIAPGFKSQHGNHWRGLSKGRYSRKTKYMRRD